MTQAVDAAEPNDDDAPDPAQDRELATAMLLRPTGYTDHVLRRTIVLPDLKILFLPIPKAGCTSLLWRLSELAGVPSERFHQSLATEVAPVLTVHDTHAWGPAYRFVRLPADVRERAFHEDGWLRFTVVRDPATRLWSAWQSKLLLREPQFVEQYGDASWFPRVPESPEHIVADFRRFVASLGTDSDGRDVHWAVQDELVGAVPLNHVGRIEALAETLTILEDHLPPSLRSTEMRRENRAPLPMPPSVYDAGALARLDEVYAADYDRFGYDHAAVGEAGLGDWPDQVSPMLPVLRLLIGRHQRIGDIATTARADRHQARRDKHQLERQITRMQLRSQSAQRRGIPIKAATSNLEGIEDFAVDWAWARPEPLERGFTAVVRVKNEADSLPFVLPPLLDAVSRVILVDNNSTDGTPDVARDTAASVGAGERLDVRTYPFSVSRCGPEHLATAPDSVHSLTYFYNWAFSLVETTYALKWDGDMVLTAAGVTALQDLAWQIETGQFIITMPRYPLYVGDAKTAFLDLSVVNREAWGWPNARGFEHVKALEWELLNWPGQIPKMSLPDWSCVELKHLDVDEFAHWSQDDFSGTNRTARKRREMQVFQALADGGEPPYGITRIDSPDDRHIIEYVRTEWIPQQKSELAGMHKKVLLGMAIRGQD